MEKFINQFVLLWTVIDPIGTLPVFLAVTKGVSLGESRKIAFYSIFIASLTLIFFVVLGEFLLDAMKIPLAAFQIAGGVVLFLFALTMIFGEGKPESELQLIKENHDKAIFPLAIPSIASPGAMMAVVLLTDNHRFSIPDQAITVGLMLFIMLITLFLLLLAKKIYKIIGEGGASVISRIMGLILASVAMSNILAGISKYFKIPVSF